jgi:hypothetical protein
MVFNATFNQEYPERTTDLPIIIEPFSSILSCHTKCIYLRFNYYHWVDTSAGGLLVPGSIIRPVVSGLALTWFTKYIYY